MHVIHPFPARMAPEIAKNAILDLGRGRSLLDPMCGSGTVIRAAIEHGVHAYGSDVDPLAVLMSKVWTEQRDTFRLAHDAKTIIERAQSYDESEYQPDWHDSETTDFTKFWFADRQREQLMRLSTALRQTRLRSRSALMLALSKTIITKDRGASLARDVSHSRPHRVAETNDFDVYDGFLKATRSLATRLAPERISASADVRRCDGKALGWVRSKSIDCIVTSPPYLNAIDYLRGHRLALVWLGYTISQTRRIRSGSVGTERAPEGAALDVTKYITSDTFSKLPSKQMAWVSRYAQDARAIVNEMKRVIKPGGRIVLVVGNSFLRGCRVDNAGIFVDLLAESGGSVRCVEREIPARRRYLPPPGGNSSLSARMRSEVVIDAHM